MRLFDRNLSFWILVCCLPLLFLPKINIISLSNSESAGIRIDDCVLLGFSGLLLLGRLASAQPIRSIEKWVLAFGAFSFVSFFLNQLFVLLGYHKISGSIFYCARIYEYFLFFYLGAISTQFFRTDSLIKALFCWNLILMLLQKWGLLGQFYVSGYLPDATDRVTGIASFPSEAGLLLSMMFCYLLYEERKAGKIYSLFPPFLGTFFKKSAIWWLFLISITLVIFTGSRIAILGMLIVIFFRVLQEIKTGSFVSLFFAAVFLCLAGYITTIAIIKTDSVFGRSVNLLSFRNIELVEKVWTDIDVSQSAIPQDPIRNNNYDMSWWIRIYKWGYALKTYVSHPATYLQGVGPGFTGPALDGGFLRLLTENGVIGISLFFGLIVTIYRQATQLKWMIVIFLINMLFFDAYLAYKPMSLLFFTTGQSFFAKEALFESFNPHRRSLLKNLNS